MRRIAIRRAATLYQMVAFALAFSLSPVDAAGHTHNEPPAAGRSMDEPSGATVPIEERLGEVHSAVVHFPIAMLLSAALSEVLLAATGQESFRYVTRFVIWIGALGAVSAAPLGWFAARMLEDAPERLLAWHRWLGVSTALWSLAALWVSEHATDRRALLRWLIGCAAVLVAITSYFGGELVHDAAAWERAFDEKPLLVGASFTSSEPYGSSGCWDTACPSRSGWGSLPSQGSVRRPGW